MIKEKDIWQQITKELRSNVPPSEFETWFLSADVARCDADRIDIRVPNKYVAIWLKDNYYKILTDSIKNTLKSDLKISFIYNDEFAPHPDVSDTPATTGAPSGLAHRLNPSFTFNTFITADFNLFARASAWEVANSPGGRYNPLYIFCRASLGKTHLLNAIGNHILQQNPSAHVRRFSGDQFSLDVAAARTRRSLSAFLEECLSLDLLLFDDIHLLANRSQSQKEFISIFNGFIKSDRQIVMTSKEAPRQIAHLLPALQSRLESGVLCEIGIPDEKAKRKIVIEKAVAKGMRLPEEVTLFLANSANDFKVLTNYLTTLEAHISLTRRKMDLSTVKRLLKTRYSRDIGVGDIQKLLASYFNIPVADLLSNKKSRQYSYPRQVGMYLIRKLTDSSLSEIGGAFGKRDHTTVIYALKRIEKDRQDPQSRISEDLKRIEALLFG